MLNYGFVIGRLGRDAELKEANGKTFLSMAIATDSGFGDNKTTQWVDVSSWRSPEKVCKYFTKGKVVSAVGQIKVREHNGKAYQSIIADNIKLIGSLEKYGNAPAEKPDAPADKPVENKKPNPDKEESFDDDFPF